MFDTVAGLPVHALVVHAVVVLLPLAAVVTAVWAFRASDPPRVGYAVVAADAVVTALAFVARFSGEAFQRRLGGEVAQEHGEIATLLPWWALALLVAAVLVQALRSGGVGMPLRLPGVLTSVVALVALGWTVRAGHTGTEAVWGEVVRRTGP